MKKIDRDDPTTRDRLLSAAIVEFARSGFDGATVRDICQRAEVNVNAIKYYFEDKRGLYIATIREAHRRNLPQQGAEELPAEGTAEERLHAFIQVAVAMFMTPESRNEPHHFLIMREMANPNEATLESVRQFAEPKFRYLNDVLAELLPPETRPIERHLLAFSVIGECLHYRVGRNFIKMLVSPSEYERLTPTRVANHITSVILAKIAAHYDGSTAKTNGRS